MHPFWVNWHSIRFKTLQVVKHPAFEYSILILIFGSSITLCFEDIYLEENEELQAILRWTNVVFAILFAVEMLFKWVALGFLYYFSSVWTALDFVIVMVSLVSVGFDDSANLSALRSLRTLRALRPLRAISRWQGMKVISFIPELMSRLFSSFFNKIQNKSQKIEVTEALQSLELLVNSQCWILCIVL